MNSSQLKRINNAISGAFRQTIDVPEYSAKQMAVLVLAALLSLMPVIIYIGFVIAGAFFYFFLSIKYMPKLSGETGFLYIIFYLVTLMLASSIMAFLIRPFFNSKVKSDVVYITRDQEPGIYALVLAISQALKLDAIERICIGADVVVDVYYGSFKDFKNKKLTLKVGLPLISTLQTNEFLALLAHEYGHISSPRLRLCYFTIRALRSWFYKIIHNEDGWNEKLADLSERFGFLRVAVIPVHLGIAVVNRIFQMFSDLLELVSISAIHDIEFFSDSVQAQIIGSENFDKSLRHLVRIDQSFHSSLEKMLSHNLVPENISELIYSMYVNNPLQSEQFIEMARSEDFNSWHMLPSPNVRAKKVAQCDMPAKVNFDGLFSSIFFDVESLGKLVSAKFYVVHGINRDVEKRDINNDMPIKMEKYSRILFRFTSGLFRRDVVWVFPEAEKFSKLPDDKVLPFLNKVVVSIRHNIPDFSKYVEFVDDYQKHVRLLHFYQWLVKDGSKNRPDTDEIEKIKFNIKEFENKHSKTLEMYKKFYGVRVSAATALGKQSKAFQSASALITMLSRVGLLALRVNDAKIKCSTLERLLTRRLEGEVLHQKTISRLTRMLLKVISDLETLINILPDPLISEFVDINIDSRKLNLEQLNGEEYELLVVDRFKELVRYYEAFNIAISAKLALFVELVERKRNIEPVVTVSLKKGEHAA